MTERLSKDRRQEPETVEVKDFGRLNDIVEALERKLRDKAKNAWNRGPQDVWLDENEVTRIWYRGQPDGMYPLLPSLHRLPHVLDQEKEIFWQYRRLDVESQQHNKDDWSVLFKMQHYEVPTRLLDWTELKLVALFFALRERDGKNPTLYLLSPYVLYSKTAEGRENRAGPFDFRREGIRYEEFLEQLKAQNGCRWRFPLPFRPDLETPRMAAQRGCFTLHGQNPAPLGQQVPESLARIHLAAELAEEIRRAMGWESDNLNILPDDPGRALHVRKKFGLDRVERSLATYVRRRWKEDLDALRKSSSEGRMPKDPLFAGLQGCALGEQYLKPRHAKDSPKLADLLKEDGTAQIGFVLAGAGAGKTNHILKAVDGEYCPGEQRDDGKPRVVLWCALGKLKADQDVFEAVADDLARDLHGDESGLRLTATPDTVRALCRSEPTLIVLDGLDELARTSGDKEAKRIIDTMARELVEAKLASPRISMRLVFGCRDHVYKRDKDEWSKLLRSRGFDPTKDVAEIELEGLAPGDVADALAKATASRACGEKDASKPGLSQTSKACEVAAEIPLFLAAVRRLPIALADLLNVKSHAEFRRLILEKATHGGHESALLDLGQVAAQMIRNRRDYLADAEIKGDPVVRETIDRYGQPREPIENSWPLFVCESGKEWRFVHQSIREYLLGRNIFDDLRGPRLRDCLVNTTTSLDYESGEVYSFVADLLCEKDDAFLPLAQECTSRAEYGSAVWNRMMRNLFEAVGMVGDVCCPKTREAALRVACEVLRNEGKGGGARPYANFMTRFNAARCIERLHGSGPKSICWFWTRGKETERSFFHFHSYAVRGFQRRHLAVRDAPWSLFDENSETRGRLDDVLRPFADEVVGLLEQELDRLLGLPELDQNHEFLAANLSLAAIRWLPFGDEWRDYWRQKVLEWCNKAKGGALGDAHRSVPLSRAVAANMELTLYYRGELNYAVEEKKEGITHVIANSDISPGSEL